MALLKEYRITEWIRNIKLTGKKVYSNCFYQFSDKNYNWEGYCSERSMFIINNECGVNRIWFYTIDFEDLHILFQDNLSESEEYLLDIIAKDKFLYCDELMSSGFCIFASMMRMSNDNISGIFNEKNLIMSYYDGTRGKRAVLEDAAAVKEKLWEVFDTRISHLPDQAGIENSIKKGEFIISKNKDAEIVTLLQSVVRPRSFYINQVYNSADKKVIHAILLSELKKYFEAGGKYLYAWVQETNKASQKFHQKYGMKQDGLWDVVYIRKKHEVL